MRILFFIFCYSLMLTGCSLSTKKLSGTYINPHYGDTLHLYTNGTFEYAEQLLSGRVGWTEGKWIINHKSIRFECDHRPLVGYRLKLRPDSLAHDFQIRLTMGDTDEPIYIENVSVYHGAATTQNTFTNSDNVVKILTRDFDSIVIRTFNFRALKFSREVLPTNGYVAEIYPVERLYELDKVPFRYRKKKLNSTKTKQYPDIKISFVKSSL